MVFQDNMKKSLHALVGAFVVCLSFGCAGGSPQEDASYKLVPITEVGMVVGEWEGLVTKDHATFPGGSVRLMIRANNTYLFAGQTTSQAAVGSGDLEARDGRLVGETDRRTVTMSLYDHKGKAVVLVESINHATGERYHGEFTKAQ
jgi:hypothetical protein